MGRRRRTAKRKTRKGREVEEMANFAIFLQLSILYFFTVSYGNGYGYNRATNTNANGIYNRGYYNRGYYNRGYGNTNANAIANGGGGGNTNANAVANGGGGGNTNANAIANRGYYNRG